MTTLRFKSNINCGSCINAVTPGLNKEETITSWEVDVTDPDKILTVSGIELTATTVINTVEAAGFEATLLEEEVSV